jgi:hypothetical protein
MTRSSIIGGRAARGVIIKLRLYRLEEDLLGEEEETEGSRVYATTESMAREDLAEAGVVGRS